MNSRAIRLTQNVLLVGLVSAALAACGSSDTGSPEGSGGEATGGGSSGSGGASAAGSGGKSTAGSGGSGATGSGGASSTGAGGKSTTGSAGSSATGSGGATSGSGGSSGKGGSSSTGDKGSGGATSQGSGGKSSAGNSGGSSGTGLGGQTGSGGGAGGATAKGSGGATAGQDGGAAGSSSGDCKKGQVKASEVVIMGESFYAMSPMYIEKRIEEKAKAAGAIGANDSYRNVAISGQPMSVVAGEFDTALQGGAVKFVIMDGGGIDCMSSACSSCPSTFTTLLAKMATNGVTDVIYTRYPEPGNPPGSNTTLKGNLDTLMPKMQAVCDASTAPKCHWVDLRPVWVNGDTSDGLHPTESGGEHVGDAIWAEMVKDCLAQ